MSALSRLTRPQVIIIGAVLIVLTAAGLYFGLVRPLQQRMAAANDRYNQNEPNGNEAAQQAAANEKKQAQKEVAAAKAEWARYEGRFFSPAIDISNLLVAMQQRWKEQSLVLGPKVTSFLRKDHSVVSRASIAVPAPPSDPNAVNTHLFFFPLGSVSVVGTFQSILKHTERWNKFDRLLLVDGLTLQGSSPRLVGQYSLTYYFFTRGKGGEPIPTAAGTAGGGGFGGPGGGGYGPPGGFGGAPMDVPGGMSGPPMGGPAVAPDAGVATPGGMSGPPMGGPASPGGPAPTF